MIPLLALLVVEGSSSKSPTFFSLPFVFVWIGFLLFFFFPLSYRDYHYFSELFSPNNRIIHCFCCCCTLRWMMDQIRWEQLPFVYSPPSFFLLLSVHLISYSPPPPPASCLALLWHCPCGDQLKNTTRTS